MKSIAMSLFILAFTAGVMSAPSFTQNPSFTYNSGQSNWTISFAVSESTDVEVSIVNTADSTVVRHLAAGMLGSNAPAPLQANSLNQTLVWDGKDDFNQTVAIASQSLNLHVRAGMHAVFDKFVGGNPYAFSDENSGYWSFNGISEGDSGLVYVAGSSEPIQFSCIRAYDGEGNYVRTVFPFRGDLQTAQVSGFGVNNWLNGQYSPQFSELRGPTFTNTILNTFNGYSLLPINGPGKIAVGGGITLQCYMINSNGTVDPSAAQVGLVTSPALPDHYTLRGCTYLAISHNPNFIYLSGYETYGPWAGHFEYAYDTGFWRDGCVWKINIQTGVATQFIVFDSVPLTGTRRDSLLGGPGDFFTSIHGVKAAANGNVLICDRLHGRIGVYDSTGGFLNALPVPNPDQVAIDAATGAVYVISRSGWHYDRKQIILTKFSNSSATATLVYSVNLWLGNMEGSTTLFVRSGADGKPRIWIGHGDIGVRIYRDDGNAVTLVKDFNATKVNNLGFDRIGIDRKTETVFITNGSNNIFKITDWTNPAQVRCSTSTKQPLLGGDLCVSYDGQLYVREQGSVSSPWNGPITRYTMDYYHAPIPFSNTGTNQMCPEVYGRSGAGYADKGLAVSPIDKHVAYMAQHNFAYYWIDTLEANGTTQDLRTTGDWAPRSIVNITGPTQSSCGQGTMKFDLKGNLYFGVTIATPEHRTPSGFAGDFAYTHGGRGSVVCYAPGDTGSILAGSNTATNSKRIYTANLGPMSYAQGGCQCRSSRFDLDAYGRLFIPSGVTQKVSVVDNNDNKILEFGRYGNWDEQGSGADIPFACPLAVAASENFMYVNDLINSRMARVRMAFTLDNMPGFGSAGTERNLASLPMALNAYPNPFKPNSRVSLSLSKAGRANLSVYDAAGRLVNVLVDGELNSGAHVFNWNALDRDGKKAAAGIYVYRLTAAGKTLIKKVVLAK